MSAAHGQLVGVRTVRKARVASARTRQGPGGRRLALETSAPVLFTMWQTSCAPVVFFMRRALITEAHIRASGGYGGGGGGAVCGDDGADDGADGMADAGGCAGSEGSAPGTPGGDGRTDAGEEASAGGRLGADSAQQSLQSHPRPFIASWSQIKSPNEPGLPQVVESALHCIAHAADCGAAGGSATGEGGIAGGGTTGKGGDVLLSWQQEPHSHPYSGLRYLQGKLAGTSPHVCHPPIVHAFACSAHRSSPNATPRRRGRSERIIPTRGPTPRQTSNFLFDQATPPETAIRLMELGNLIGRMRQKM